MKNPYQYPGIVKIPYTLKRIFPYFDFTDEGYSKAKEYLISIKSYDRFNSAHLDARMVVIIIANHLKLYETRIGNRYNFRMNGATTHLLKDSDGRIIYTDDDYNADGSVKYFVKRPQRTGLYFIPVGTNKNIEIPIFVPRFMPPNL